MIKSFLNQHQYKDSRAKSESNGSRLPAPISVIFINKFLQTKWYDVQENSFRTH